MKQTHLTAECKHFLQALLAYDPEERPAIDNLVEQPWLHLPVPTHETVHSHLIKLYEVKTMEEQAKAERDKERKKNQKS